jgi:Fe2+ transport system protein FeoA
MAYNKDNYENNRLTPAQEEFCQQIMQGLSQRQAYYIAYPNSKKWKETSVDCNASQLMDNTKVKQRLLEMGYKDTKKVEWTRKKALETINYVMDINRQDIERMQEGYQTEIDIKEVQLMQYAQMMTMPNVDTNRIAKNMQEITNEIAQLKKQRRINGTNIKGIYEGAKILNRMFGYDITKVEINQKDIERENMENSLSVEELKAIAYASKSTNNGTNTEES